MMAHMTKRMRRRSKCSTMAGSAAAHVHGLKDNFATIPGLSCKCLPHQTRNMKTTKDLDPFIPNGKLGVSRLNGSFPESL